MATSVECDGSESCRASQHIEYCASKAVDRMSRGYEPRFDLDYREGHVGEDFSGRVSDGMANGTVETKTDKRALDDVLRGRDGNVYVEFKAWSNASQAWEPSGIATTEAQTWAFVLAPDVLVAVNVEVLRAVARRQWTVPSLRKSCMRGSNPTNGVLIPIPILLQELMKESGGA